MRLGMYHILLEVDAYMILAQARGVKLGALRGSPLSF